MSTIKINRALKLAAIGTNPGSAADMLAAIPADVIEALPARLLAELLDANWSLACRSKSLADAAACDEGAVWDARHQRLRAVA